MKDQPQYVIDYAGVDEDPPPDGDALREQGIVGAFVRADYGALRDGTFHRDAQRILDAGLALGAYTFQLHGRKVPDHDAEADAFAAETDRYYSGGHVVLPPMVDYEIPRGNAATGLSTAELEASLIAGVGAYRRRFKIAPILYISGRVYNTVDADCLGNPPAPPELVECPLALAHYVYATGLTTWYRDPGAPPIIPNPWNDVVPPRDHEAGLVGDNYWFHQYQGDCRGIRGIRQADVSVFHPLSIGARGKRTAYVQRRVGADVDGSFGPQTEEAVKEFQVDVRIPATGVVDLWTFEQIAWCTGWLRG